MDIVKGAAASAGLFLSYVLLVIGGPISAALSPFPVMYYGLKSGRPVGIAIVLLASAAVAFLSLETAVMYLMQCGVFALLITEFVRRGTGASRAIFFTVVICLTLYAMLFVGYGIRNGVDVNALILKGINSAVIQSESLYARTGISGNDLEALRYGLRQTGRVVGAAYPSLVAVLLGAIAGINLLLLKKVSANFSKKYIFGEFKSFRNPDLLVWVLIASGFALLPGEPTISKIALNILIPVVALYFLQGLAITSSLSDRFGFPRFMRLIFYVIIAVQPYLMAVVAALGLFDLWCGFRTPKNTENL